MKSNTIYVSALIIGSLGAIITMIFHPNVHDIIGQPDEIARRSELMTVLTHSLGIFSFPVLFFGLLGFSRQIGWERPLVTAALISYAVGCFGGICAAVINGLVAPEITRQMSVADPQSRENLNIVLMNNTLLNQGFSKLFVVSVAVAMIFWSLSITRKSRLSQVVAGIGFLVGLFSLLGLFSGHLRLNVHGFGLIILGQTIWTILLSVYLYLLSNVKTLNPNEK